MAKPQEISFTSIDLLYGHKQLKFDVTVVFGLGCHRKQTDKECEMLVGREMAGQRSAG